MGTETRVGVLLGQDLQHGGELRRDSGADLRGCQAVHCGTPGMSVAGAYALDGRGREVGKPLIGMDHTESTEGAESEHRGALLVGSAGSGANGALAGTVVGETDGAIDREWVQDGAETILGELSTHTVTGTGVACHVLFEQMGDAVTVRWRT